MISYDISDDDWKNGPVPLGLVTSRPIRDYAEVLTFREIREASTVKISVPNIGKLIDRMIRACFDNVLRHSTGEVWLRSKRDAAAILAVEVIDGGGGFNPAVFDDPSTTLGKLRHDARRLGGDVTTTMAIPTGWTVVGTCVRLTVPLSS